MSTITALRAEPTELRSSTSRVNGAKSRGPVTDEGKLASSQNSLKHGLYSADLLLVNENSEEFLNLKECLVNSIKPEDEYEMLLITRLAVGHTKLNRVLKIETEMLNASLEQGETSYAIFYNSQGALNTVLRYIAAAERLIDKTTRELALHRKSKQSKAKSYKNEQTNPRPEVVPHQPQPRSSEPDKMAKNEQTNPSSETLVGGETDSHSNVCRILNVRSAGEFEGCVPTHPSILKSFGGTEAAARHPMDGAQIQA
jgi:hypothetical protein